MNPIPPVCSQFPLDDPCYACPLSSLPQQLSCHNVPSSAIILMHSVPGKVPMRPLREPQQSASQNFCVLLKESSQSGLLWLMDVHLKHPRPSTETEKNYNDLVGARLQATKAAR